MYTTHQTNNLNSGFFLQQHWLISKYRQYICDYSLLARCHFILLWMCFHQSPNALPPQTQHNFWNGLEALAPASKLMQKCCLHSHKRLLYVVEGCFLLSTLYQWRTSENHRGHLHYNSWWMSGTTSIPFEHSCPQRLGNEGSYWPQNHYLLCLGRQSILQTSPSFFVFHLTNQGLTAPF